MYKIAYVYDYLMSLYLEAWFKDYKLFTIMVPLCYVMALYVSHIIHILYWTISQQPWSDGTNYLVKSWLSFNRIMIYVSQIINQSSHKMQLRVPSW